MGTFSTPAPLLSHLSNQVETGFPDSGQRVKIDFYWQGAWVLELHSFTSREKLLFPLQFQLSGQIIMGLNMKAQANFKCCGDDLPSSLLLSVSGISSGKSFQSRAMHLSCIWGPFMPAACYQIPLLVPFVLVLVVGLSTTHRFGESLVSVSWLTNMVLTGVAWSSPGLLVGQSHRPLWGSQLSCLFFLFLVVFNLSSSSPITLGVKTRPAYDMPLYPTCTFSHHAWTKWSISTPTPFLL